MYVPLAEKLSVWVYVRIHKYLAFKYISELGMQFKVVECLFGLY